MAQGKPIDSTIPMGSIEAAVVDERWKDARHLMAAKLARMMDNTDCARDVKSISLSLTPLIDQCEADTREESGRRSSPLADVLAEAEAILNG